MTTAKNAAHFRAAWQSHVKQLAQLPIQATDDLADAAREWNAIRAQLFDLIERAAAHQWPDEVAGSCLHCGRDLGEYGGRCTSDDCPGNPHRTNGPLGARTGYTTAPNWTVYGRED